MGTIRLAQQVREGAAMTLRQIALVMLFLLSGCLVTGERSVPSLNVSSAAFNSGAPIPVMYTCDGANASPPLSWSGVPQGTAGLALVVSDPDASRGTFIHWVAYNIPPGTREIPAGAPGKSALPAGSVQGTNDFGRAAYGGPCPPPGKPHHYHFTVYALDAPLTLSGNRDAGALTQAIAGHVLARGELVGIYQRR